MTNNWTDIGNASAVVVMGANPVENHPACMAHINTARKNGGKLIVIDPRKTRTALQCNPDKGERYIRMRPGTDIAVLNGIVRGIMEKMNSGAGVDPAVRTKFFEFLNENSAGTFWPDAGGGAAGTVSVAGNGKYTDARFLVNTAGTDYVRATATATNSSEVSKIPVKSTDCRTNMTIDDVEYMTVYNRMWEHVKNYTPAVVQDISGMSPADLEFLVNIYIENGRCSSVGPITGAGSQDPRVSGYKCTTMLYAMGQTQHTCGSQNVKAFAVIQTLMGNVGRAGGGINALRGIHNVQGSTDQGVLAGNIPFYSGNPATMTSADANAFGKYMDALWGSPLNGTGTRATMNGSYDDAYNNTAFGLQQRGFINMTYDFFGRPAWKTVPTADRTLTNGLYDLWPKGNGHYHITMFREMAAGRTKGCLVWGQNPAITQPYQGAVRKGLKELDILVVVDLFENETAAVDRKDGAPTYLIPASSHVEEAGSVANSGRVLQWREKACEPKGNSKADLELLFRLAYSLDKADAFSHLTAQWAALGQGTLNAYDVLYYDRYGYKPGTSLPFEQLSGTAEIWRGDDPAPTTGTVYGSEWIAEQIYRSMNPSGAAGTSWLYTGAYEPNNMAANKHANQPDWKVANRSKSREVEDWNGTRAYPGWGYSWLVNRRVLYNNGDIPGDVGDFYMGPDSVSRLFVTSLGSKGADLNYSRWYRFYHGLSDMPSVGATGPHHLPGRFPAHTEPYETPREDLASTYGRNTTLAAGNQLGTDVGWNLVPNDTPVVGKNKTVADLASSKHNAGPLVLTTARCVEHFQGGPITRNNPWNVEAEPEPWVEINSIDAAARGISTGDWVNVFTVRGDSTTAGQQALSPNSGPTSKGFRARVGVGAEDNQRVGVGVVMVPWHWGDKGLSTGARANDLCIDAGDANTTIPESKACLCQIEKM
ncbi:MAG: molybdopterin-dependent oxidoreductase [Coriobacteriia bacterium]|nr:molybdopterin-dependent oxidoreductase [Coriobacteriia bacterium]